ncbi:hypothetical protein [Nitrosococcus wardiae]|uniref:Uncharacterized protein n=1 Tax=Nitrosococcus wardiae TaxID=1814290 RepID=A0A4P7C585_9GAMM|nr:hypothetical protein [Nitrosococcus wardiae]QBQ56002.1 hypothetical protein E3U44_16900 [Nitrosococcus wardiae]
MNQEHRLIHFRWVLALAKSGLVLVMILGAAGCRSQLPQVTYSDPYQRAIRIMAVGLNSTTVETLMKFPHYQDLAVSQAKSVSSTALLPE